MSDSRAEIPSVVERTRSVKADAAIVAAHFLGDTAVFVQGEQSLLLVPRQGEPRAIVAHAGAILCSATQHDQIVTGGDDGKVAATRADGTAMTLATDEKRRWIDHVATRPDGTVAWSAGKQVFVRSKDNERSIELPSTVGGLAFASKGVRLAAAHYNGVTLWFPNATSKPEVLAWKGSHLAVIFSRDGRFLISSMQEPMLHGWRLSDRKDMQMSGYAARVRSFAFTADGKLLATSGANQLILWPLHGKDGPMGKAPQIFAPSESSDRCRRLSPSAGHSGRRLCGRACPACEDRRRRGDSGAQARRDARYSIDMERERHCACVRDGRRRSGYCRPDR